MKKWLRTMLFVVLVLALLISGVCINKAIQCKIVIHKFIEQLKTEDAGDLTLIIYYMHPSILTDMPVTIDMLISNCEQGIAGTNKIVVNGRDIKEHLDLFVRLEKVKLKPVLKIAALENVPVLSNVSGYSDIRCYYVLDSKKNGQLLDVAMWGYDVSKNLTIFVNGVEVKENTIFYDMMMPFCELF